MKCEQCGNKISSFATPYLINGYTLCKKCFSDSAVVEELKEQPSNKENIVGESPKTDGNKKIKTEKQWYYARNNEQFGPINEKQLLDLITQQVLKTDNLVWTEGMDNWQTIGLMEESLTTATKQYYAGFWLRFFAYWIDFVLLFIVGSVLLAVVNYPFGLEPTAGPFEFFGNMFVLVNNPFGLLMSWLYFALMESSSYQATFGKQAIGIKVTDLNGKSIGFGKASGRHFGKIVSGIIIGIGYIMAGFTKKKQALHDMMANCLVVVNYKKG